MSLKSNIRKFLVGMKEDSLLLKYIWLLSLERRAKREKATMSDVDCINAMYFRQIGHYPDLEHPKTFSEKMQWLKVHYRNELMPIVADKYAVREYLEQQGYGYLLNDLLAVYDDISKLDINSLPKRFVFKASHGSGSGWNCVVKDKAKVNWFLWKKFMRYWLRNDIAWQGREWHYATMKPHVIFEKYLEDKSGGLMDYKFYCFNGEPAFLQVNVDRGLPTSTQNYYDLDWKLLPFGKSQPHNPNANVECPDHFQEMIKVARELSKPFPYVRVDFYEANDRLYFGEFTFFPASGLPDFIPAEWDEKVGAMLTLPKANN